ncbi:hypothetical protein BDV25DRAFT_149904 [Aspergillus avenaceus]|uniref:Zn(2)-C6 fungal-type domain-containing protein n=1 Tax=Aspergillus avenaceus TaxID=36643 RepID=A0A5N6U3N7_ASPAV|nr:hypothetical protein BDV25DRAFT_149904 [Aspergillus avenaceus]
MAEILAACDRCHSRKVKCDRQLKCANCADASVACRRRRPMRVSKQKVPLGIPEESIISLGEEPNRSRIEQSNSPSGPDGEGLVDPGLGREASRSDTSRRDEAVATSTHYSEQARVVIQTDLNSRNANNLPSSERRRILESAVKLVESIANGEEPDPERTATSSGMSNEYSHVDIPPVPPVEMLFMLLPEPVVCEGLYSHIRWPDHISDRTFEHMMTSLLNQDCQGQLWHQYSICVYVKAMFHLYQLSRLSANINVKQQLHKAKKTYEAAALHSLKHLNMMSTPSLTSIQALISGALLMQHISNMSQCWQLNSYAARQIIFLKYHRISNASTEISQEIQVAVCWCFYLDRTISSLLLRHPSLPELRIPPTDAITLDTSLPYNKLLLGLLDLAQVQSAILDINLNSDKVAKSHGIEICQGLQDQMATIHLKLVESRALISGPVLCDWIAADFCYFAIYVDILRTRVGYDGSQATHSACLVYSRQALQTFQFLQEHLNDLPGFIDPDPSFLTWTVSLYPATPFFVLFCNIINSSNIEDRTLVQRVIEGLSQFKPSPYLATLLRLLTSIQRLCDPLFATGQRRRPSSLPQGNVVSDQQPNQSASSPSIVPGPGMELPQDIHMSVFPSTTVHGTEELWGQGEQNVPFPTADDLMWELFNSQLPLGGYDMDIVL